METQREQMTMVLPWLVRWTRRYKRFLSCLGCSSQPSKKYYFPRRTLFHCISPHRPAGQQQPVQAGVLGRLSLCLWSRQYIKTKQKIYTHIYTPKRRKYNTFQANAKPQSNIFYFYFLTSLLISLLFLRGAR
jgi:hypothetical protein